MKPTFNPVVLRKKAAEFEKMAKRHYDLAKAIEKSGLYSVETPTSKNGISRRSAAWRKQQSEKLKKYWAEKKRKEKSTK